MFIRPKDWTYLAEYQQTIFGRGIDLIDFPYVDVRVKKLPGFEDFELPTYATTGAVCLDLRAALDEPVIHIWPGMRKLIPSGIAIALPPGYEAQIRPRSGLAYKQGVTLANSPGTIDSDYRGPVGVLIINHGEDRVRIKRGDRIAQMLVQAVPRIQWIEVEDELDKTDRGRGGYGSTGK
jgi:dUTP pyrophosphatase